MNQLYKYQTNKISKMKTARSATHAKVKRRAKPHPSRSNVGFSYIRRPTNQAATNIKNRARVCPLHR